MKTFEFNNHQMHIQQGRYGNNRTALLFVDAQTGETYLTATINTPKQHLDPGEICIKTWDENEGVLEFLISEGIVSESKYSFPVGLGFAIVHVVELLTTDF